MVQDQYIFPPMGGTPVALNQCAIHDAMNLYAVENPQECFELVVMLYREICQERGQKAAAERDERSRVK